MIALARSLEPLPGTDEVPRQHQAEQTEVEADAPVERVDVWVGGGGEGKEREDEDCIHENTS